jgi:hypothetical protein
VIIDNLFRLGESWEICIEDGTESMSFMQGGIQH